MIAVHINYHFSQVSVLVIAQGAFTVAFSESYQTSTSVQVILE